MRSADTTLPGEEKKPSRSQRAPIPAVSMAGHDPSLYLSRDVSRRLGMPPDLAVAGAGAWFPCFARSFGCKVDSHRRATAP